MLKESLGDIIRAGAGWDVYNAYSDVERYCQLGVDASVRQPVWRDMANSIRNSLRFGLRIDENGYLVQLE